MNNRNGNPELTVLLVAHNREETIEAALHSILEQDYPMERVEILLVADRCRDRTVERARAIAGNTLRTIAIDTPPEGMTARQAALHTGLTEARGEIVLLARADGRVPRDWVHQMSGHMSFRDGAITAPVIYAGARHFFARYQTLDAMAAFGLSYWMASHGMAAPVTGGNLIVQRDAYLETGGFPAIGFAPDEGAALGVRLKRAGWSVRYLTAPVTRNPAAAGWGDLLTHARRHDHSVPWLFSFVYGMAIASFLILLVCAMSFHGVWWFWFALRYALGMAMTAVGVTLCGSYGLLRSLWYYEPVMALLNVAVFIHQRVLRRPWRWEDVRYDDKEPLK
jgi:cellulose synthase/poly-beta-1,6-N-acetylglucosamine synthase-like glycosyltransferase